MAVVLASGSADLLAANMFAGADGYVAKPFSAHSAICGVMGLARYVTVNVGERGI